MPGLPQHHTAGRTRSVTASTSTQTRLTIPPTVRHATGVSNVTVVFEHAAASQATVSSKYRVGPAPVSDGIRDGHDV
jgi:hypothetical protein